MGTRIIFSRRLPLLSFALLLLLAACGQGAASNSPGSTPTSTAALDVFGTPVVFPKTPPKRIVSLLPSTSEILGALNLEKRVVAVDYNTEYPALAAKPKISSADGKYNVEQIVNLKPDLVLSYGGETRQYDRQLELLGINVVDLQLSNLSQMLQQIKLVGQLTFTGNTADALAQRLQKQIDQLKAQVAGTAPPTVLLEIDNSTPGVLYVFGGGSFGDELAQDANALNIFHSNSTNGGYPRVSDEAVISANPQYVILTEDPAYGGNVNAVYKRANWSNVVAVKAHKVYRINVNIMQQPGPRLVEGLRCLAQLVHADKFSEALPAYCTATA
jgi:iron complex transport system substrate-binding protein